MSGHVLQSRSAARKQTKSRLTPDAACIAEDGGMGSSSTPLMSNDGILLEQVKRGKAQPVRD
jgi:hypothetical protein